MPLKARSSARRRRKNPDEERPAEPASSAQVMAPTRMKLRGRRRDTAGGGDPLAEEERQRSRESSSSSSRRKNTSKSSAAAVAAASSSPPTSSASTSARPPLMAADETSPDSKCPICLDRFNNLAYLDRCLHRFCFPCIQEWSHNKAECPLCKQPFASILHSVRAEDDFKEYTLRPAPANNSVAATVAMVAAMAARNTHQMRLMLRRHRVSDASETTARRRRRERGARRAGVWEWYLDSPPLPPPPLPQPSVITEDNEDREEQRMRGGADLAERGVIFEGLTGLGGAVAPVAPNDRASRRLMTRLAARQRLQREGGTVRRLRERETVAFRRGLYRCGIRVRGVAGVNGNPGQQRDITAESFHQNPAHLNRLRPWLRRELTVLYGSHTSLVDIVQRIIMARLARHGLENTPTIEEELRPFLLARTEHFLHELVSFARSPLSLDSYDLQAVYEPLDAALELDGMSSSSESSSVIAISEGEEEERVLGRRSEGREVGPQDDVIQTGSVLSLSGWDDETPGPSYSTAEPSCSFSPAQPESANQEGGERREDEEECLIVGYKKPIAERTPELVQLSSDTEEEEEEKKNKEEELPPPPSATPPLSYLPTIPPSTSSAFRDEQEAVPKDGEAAGRSSRARSWSVSSCRSRNSVCTLSPPTPGEGERQREIGSWRDRKSGGEVVKEKRRRKRRKRGRERSSDPHKKSGTLFNPNRSIYPGMIRHRSRSSSPFDSSADSGSPLPPSPADSSWEYHCSQVSPLTSSASSPSCSSSSPHPPLPRTPPTPSHSPGDRHGEKPGGKRKYKSRHLDNNVKDPTWRPSTGGGGRKEKKERKRRRKERDGGGRRKERHRRASGGYCGESSRRAREDRSPSVEIIYEGTIATDTSRPPGQKRRRKRHRKPQNSSSPVIITLDSDSSHDEVNNKNSSISSSPLSSQQTVDFSDLPPLPLVHSTGVGGALDAEIGELPVDILDRGSDGSDTEPMGPSKTAGPIAVDNSDPEVDVENVEDDVEGPIKAADTKALNAGTVGGSARPMGEQDAARVMTDLLHRRPPEPSTSDSHLLASILSDLEGISARNINAGCSPDSRERLYRDPCAVNQAHRKQDGWSAEFPEEQQSNTVRVQNEGVGLQTGCTSIISPPPLKRWKEGRDAPPLLRQASPVQSYNRNTPPPLKHKDAGSPHHSPVSPVDLYPHRTAADQALLGLNPTDSPSDSRLAAKLPNDCEVISSVSTLKGHFTSTLALRGEPGSASSFSVASDHKPPHSSFGCGTPPTAAPYYSFNSSALHSSHQSSMGISSSCSPADLHPGISSSSIDICTDSTSGGCRAKTANTCRVPPVDLHPFHGAAERPPAGSGVFSGVNSHDTPLPVCDSRTQNASLSTDSPSSSDLSPVSLRAAPRGMLPTTNLHPVDLHSSSVASGQTDTETPSVVSHKGRSPSEPDCTGLVPPANSHSACLINRHLNHTALSSSAHSQHAVTYRTTPRKAELGIDANPHNHVDPTEPHSKHHLPADSEPPPQKHSQRDFEPHTDNHITPENQRNSDSSVDAHSYEHSAT